MTSTKWAADEWPVCDITELAKVVHYKLRRTGPVARCATPELERPYSHKTLDDIADELTVEMDRQSAYEVDWRSEFVD